MGSFSWPLTNTNGTDDPSPTVSHYELVYLEIHVDFTTDDE